MASLALVVGKLYKFSHCIQSAWRARKGKKYVVQLKAEKQAALEELMAKLVIMFNLDGMNHGGSFRIKYQDDEGDLVSITDDDPAVVIENANEVNPTEGINAEIKLRLASEPMYPVTVYLQSGSFFTPGEDPTCTTDNSVTTCNFEPDDEQVIFQDGPQVHQCKCNPGWCVSPLQRAHPRRPAQPSD